MLIKRLCFANDDCYKRYVSTTEMSEKKNGERAREREREKEREES